MMAGAIVGMFPVLFGDIRKQLIVGTPMPA